jgi:carbamoyltransferase
MTAILGINPAFSANHHDASAALITDAGYIGAVEEERISRVKSAVAAFPSGAIKTLLNDAGISIRDVKRVFVPSEKAGDLIIRVSRQLQYEFGFSPEVVGLHHEVCHADGAFISSGFDEAVSVSVDGYGDGLSGLALRCTHDGIEVLDQFAVKDSLGNFYGAMTELLGFSRLDGQYKVMGMAAYGKVQSTLKARLLEAYKSGKFLYCGQKLINVSEPIIDLSFSDHLIPDGYRVYGNREFSQVHFDFAATVQSVFEDLYLDLLKKYRYVSENVCLSGGVALNCLANRHLRSIFKNVYVMPAASDRGLSLGAALIGFKRREKRDVSIKDMFLGPLHSVESIRRELRVAKVSAEEVSDPSKHAADAIAAGKIVGWFRGRSEFGPRALGGRSILAAPFIAGMKDRINSTIKFRESYRPFAPAVLTSFASRHGIEERYPHMTIAVQCPASMKPSISEAVHHDGTIRLLTVCNDEHPLYPILNALKSAGLPPAVINTSFNLSGEPLVESPRDALRTFYSCGIDEMYLENLKLKK